MKQKLILFFLFFVCVPTVLLAQNDSIQKLDEVLITTDSQLKLFSDTQSVLQLNDSVLRVNQPLLTSLLNYNTPIYFKENGLGMVSSPAFRGTTAQQTAVVWNGININSQLNGQTDFNTINTSSFNNVSVRSGGGSVIYGSGAIGGSIHLNNRFNYSEGFQNSLLTNYGSFNTFLLDYKANVTVNRLSANIGISRNSSDNDYDFVNSDDYNHNGNYYNTSLTANLSYRLNPKHLLNFYSYVFDGERHLSLILPTETPTKYKDFNTRQLIEWQSFYNTITTKLKLAYLSENYKYFGNINTDTYTFGSAETVIAKYDVTYVPTDNVTVNGIIDYTQNNAEGSSIANEKRHIGSSNLLFKHQLNSWFLYEMGIRQEVTNTYNSPFLYNVGLQFQVAKPYTITVNGSKNFRIPTFNDLYWEGSGNPDLAPETAYQAEIGNHLQFKNANISLTAYYNDISDMIRWVPNGSLWRPINTDHVMTYGLEALAGYKHDFGEHHISVNGTYAYTVSENKDTKKQLIYVPYHKATASLGYNYKKISAVYQWLAVGSVFTTTDNLSRYELDAYQVSNIGIDYAICNTLTLGGKVNNLWNVNYQSVENRFMPGRHYSIYLNFNI
ncbi:TonB-dependent receptor [Formosa agariphila KMM 3901]|uniref:TonB-dependent receptor n=1 Tax=Formosa agariphila (strain DSM 15362 / KCTC 12365 / LMG 23005 / KMM 3901 / M-2Alg 35-1) TaxID=1347342 RepID=T2KM06_FORAG|nr:TonB-dependent receptor [Formosa agariphila]CDF79760.1 TonB-dependent receptor [Formosa agariphila KMM 3901]